MHDVMRKRIMRKLDALPEPQLYQVLDYIEFLEQRHAALPAASATGFQRFAERFEDEMRVRSLAARTMSGAMKVFSVAGRVVDGLTGAFEATVGGQRPVDRDGDASDRIRQLPRGADGSGTAPSEG
jgi:hypothetical protein